MIVNSTGFWNLSDYGSTPIFNTGEPGNIFIVPKDKLILVNLAKKVFEISQREIERKKKEVWVAHNDLKLRKPLVFCDPENAWNEIITEKNLNCSGVLARKWEMVLKKEIFWATNLKDDKVIEPYFNIGYTHKNSGWGLDAKFQFVKGGSYTWISPLNDFSDLKKLRYPIISINSNLTNQTLELANEVFGDYLKVRVKGIWWWTLGLTMILVFLRGLERTMVDMYDNPSIIHEIMKFLMKGTLMQLKFLEGNGLLSLNNDHYVGSGGFGYTDQLPKKGFCEKKVRLIDIWGFAESQETIGISPSMFEEFIFKYQLPLLELFGLTCYGCCEPLEKRWNIIKKIPNLRRVSVSSWANFAQMAENLQDKYIYSLKVKPTDVTQPMLDEDTSRKRLRNILEQCNGCILEIILKDTQTIGRNPKNLIRWVEIAKEESEKYYNKQ